ncbi:AraC family transcriptional regulator [Paracoccus marinaquae]|uniref:AraC family transcriptional regulator n=1 Tax=Paracoccus marinaquae TaxID=2841926 RepID=A0ABS6AF60_9RHOB|nr:AraC family transcriptional regulator [Paracoccus marinaquae]MBU3029240.1 AraC family transcriptional regulator [Paracoccus marinaquae]
MTRLASQLPPQVQHAALVGASSPPMISATTMTGVAGLVREVLGERTLKRASQAIMLDIELIENRDCFIPQATMAAFLDVVDRSPGGETFGLLVVPEVSFDGLGKWSEHVLSSGTLGAAILRAGETLNYHSTGDRLNLSVFSGMARFSYYAATRGLPGHSAISSGTAGVMLSLMRSYLSTEWRPWMIELDIPRPRNAGCYEDQFSCPVIFGAKAVTICFDAGLLGTSRSRTSGPRLTTLEDVIRSRYAPISLNQFPNVVVAQIWAQVLTGQVSIESTACALDISIRSLQRILNAEGIGFRELVSAIRTQRARELLRGTSVSITEIAFELGYATSAGFARAFRKATGLAPHEYRDRSAPVA